MTTPLDKSKCPKCASPNPAHHPAVQFEGEVHLCDDPWHKPTAAEIRAKEQTEHSGDKHATFARAAQMLREEAQVIYESNTNAAGRWTSNWGEEERHDEMIRLAEALERTPSSRARPDLVALLRDIRSDMSWNPFSDLAKRMAARIDAALADTPSSTSSSERGEPPVIFSAGKWVYMGNATTPSSEHDSRELDAAAWHKLRAPSSKARDAQAFTPLGLVEWLQRWWKLDATWRNEQRATLGHDTAPLLRGVADMLEQPCEGPEHVCGLQGFNPAIDPPCPGCVASGRIRPEEKHG